MKTTCPPAHHHNGFVAARERGNMMYCRTSCAQVHELPKSPCGDIFFMIVHIYYAHLAFVRFEHCMSWIT